MGSTRRYQILIVLASIIVFFTNLGVTGLWDLDEALYTSIAREMSVRGDWVVPTFNREIFYDKPPLMFWLMMASFKVLGVSEFAARLTAALLGVGTVLATYRLGRRLFSEQVGFWAGLGMASTVIFTVSARAATVDAALTFVTLLVIWVFAAAAGIGSADTPTAARDGFKTEKLAYLPTHWQAFAAIGLLLGLAVLAKGPVGFLLPAAVLGLFLLVMNRAEPAAEKADTAPAGWLYVLRSAAIETARLFSPGNLLRTTWAMRPLLVLGCTALVAVPWFALIAWQTDGEWLRQFVTKYNVGPFMKPFLGHRGPFYYHFVVVLVGLFPWSIFLGPTLTHAYRSLRNRDRDFPSYVLLVCWITVFFGFWSMCSTKLPHYVLPAYPALILLTARFLCAWLQRPEAAARGVMLTATSIFLAVGAAMLVALPFITARYAPGEQIIAAIGIMPLVGGALGLYFLRQQRRTAYLNAFAVASVLFVTALFAWAAMRIDRHQHSRPLMAEIRGDSPDEPQIAGYRYIQASTVYYAGGPLTHLDDPAGLRAFLRQSSHPYVITTDAEYDDLQKQLPEGVQLRMVARRPRFLAKGEVVVVAPMREDSPALSRREAGAGRF